MDELLIERAHAEPSERVAESLNVDPARGLTEAEAEARRRRHGANELRRQAPARITAILLHQLDSVVVWLLVAAAALSMALGDGVEAAAIVVVLLINTGIGFATELRAARTMEALYRIVEVNARVRRDGRNLTVDAQELVPGDIVLLEAGDVVTADMRLLPGSRLECDESVLTGESVPDAKSEAAVPEDAPLGDRTGMVYKGCAVTRGVGEGVVTATGMASEIGRIARLMQEAEDDPTPLERRLDRLGRRLVWLTLAIAAVTVALGVLRGQEATVMVQTGVALAVAAIPEGLPIVATLCLARGMLRMARRNAMVNRLSSVETLGSTTLIVTDKTGTLTENRMTVERLVLPDGDVDAASIPGPVDGALAWALCAGACCNTAEPGEGDAVGTGDPMELAMLAAAERVGLVPSAFCGVAPASTIHAFDPDRLMMATVHPQDDGFRTFVKGAPEAVLAICTRVLDRQGEAPLDSAGRDGWRERTRAATSGGLRCLALAMRRDAAPPAEPYEDLTLIGLICLADPLREDVPDAIAACRAAGIDVVMCTGDHAATASAIAEQAGIAGRDAEAIDGSELVALDRSAPPAPRIDRLRDARIFARVPPAAKLELIALHQASGSVVAMTGDGVNDAPALRKADIGVAMGRRGTQVAREASDVVLLDDAFSTIVEAVSQGRVIFENIRKFVVYLMSCNVSEVMVVGLAVGAGLPVPLLPLQILFLNLVTDVFPAFALGLGEGGRAVMASPPRDPAEAIVDRRRWIWIGLLGGAIALSTLAAFAAALFALGLPADAAVTVAFLSISLAQLWNVFNVRAARSGLILNDVTRNRYVWFALTLCLALIAAAIWAPGLSEVLRLPSPGPAGVVLAFGASLLPLVFGQALLLSRRDEAARSPAAEA